VVKVGQLRWAGGVGGFCGSIVVHLGSSALNAMQEILSTGTPVSNTRGAAIQLQQVLRMSCCDALVSLHST
jgi:hypothetical protein